MFRHFPLRQHSLVSVFLLAICALASASSPSYAQNLYVGNVSGSTISEFNSSGVFVQSIGNSNLNNPRFIAFASSPALSTLVAVYTVIV